MTYLTNINQEVTVEKLNVIDNEPELNLIDTGNRDYRMSIRDGKISFDCLTATYDSDMALYSFDGDGTDNIEYIFYAVGTRDSHSDNETFSIKYQASSTEWRLHSRKDGTGTLRPLLLGNEDHENQITLNIDGKVGINKAAVDGALDIDLSTEDTAIVDAGSAGATEQDWIEVTVGGNQGYIRVYAAK